MTTKSPVVLAVEDESVLVGLLAVLLAPHCEVRIWTSGFEELLNSEAWEGVEVALLDQMLPKVSGLEIAKFLRMNNPAVRIVFLTAVPRPEMEEFADVVLQKPASREEILDAVLGLEDRK